MRITPKSFILFPCQQIRTIAERFLKSGGAPPIGHFRVIPANQNFRYAPAAILCWARVMGKIQKNVTRDW